MSLLRFAARTMFASYFIADGVKGLRDAEDLAPRAEKFTGAVAPTIQRVLPSEMAPYVPDQAKTWVRISSGAQVAGGLMFATGFGRRLGALLLTKASILNLAMALPSREDPKQERLEQLPEVLANAALLGGALLQTLDLEGKPSLSWQAEHAAKSVEQRGKRASTRLNRKASKAAKKASREAKRIRKQAKAKANELGKKLDSASA